LGNKLGEVTSSGNLEHSFEENIMSCELFDEFWLLLAQRGERWFGVLDYGLGYILWDSFGRWRGYLDS